MQINSAKIFIYGYPEFQLMHCKTASVRASSGDYLESWPEDVNRVAGATAGRGLT